jgi:hypothetical protein
MKPHAREEGLVIQEMDAETVVYDLRNHKAHSLNRIASRVWRLCDGQTSPAGIAERLTMELDTYVDEQVVALALEQLSKASLLREKMSSAPLSPTLSRRALARRLGLIGGLSLLVPVVTSIIAPTPAQAALSCALSGQPCGGVNPPCCTGTCLTGTCP